MSFLFPKIVCLSRFQKTLFWIRDKKVMTNPYAELFPGIRVTLLYFELWGSHFYSCCALIGDWR